ncbi:MAG: glycosyltransferase [Nitrospira sp.]|nr:MAG: glycosyltransferase [Nitrospira sp.]
MIVHKSVSPSSPRLSIILLDWGCRERFTTLDWLLQQDVPKDKYELIWVEVYDRVVDEVLKKADVVITCNQQGIYHKHVGYNVGLLHARGELICVCDSDAVFPPDFVRSVFRSFQIESGGSAVPLVLMHYEWRTSLLYPEGLTDAETLKDSERWQWWPLIVNEGACMTVRRADAIRFGGFDEHPSYRGYLCGPYDLGWRLINAGWQEVWHDEAVALWHFAHPDPIGTNGQRASLKQLLEKAYPHINGHALTAVEAFSTGRFQPLRENHDIWALRMRNRRIGSELETRYADLTEQSGYSPWAVWSLWLSLAKEIIGQYLGDRIWIPFRKGIVSLLGPRVAGRLRAMYQDRILPRRINYEVPADAPTLLCSVKRYNLVKFKDEYFAVPKSIGHLDLSTDEGRVHPDLLVASNYEVILEKVHVASRG